MVLKVGKGRGSGEGGPGGEVPGGEVQGGGLGGGRFGGGEIWGRGGSREWVLLIIVSVAKLH